MDWKETRTTEEFCPTVAGLEISDELSSLLANVTYQNVCAFEQEIKDDLMQHVTEEHLQAGLLPQLNVENGDIVLKLIYTDQSGQKKSITFNRGKVKEKAASTIRKINPELGLDPDTGSL